MNISFFQKRALVEFDNISTAAKIVETINVQRVEILLKQRPMKCGYSVYQQLRLENGFTTLRRLEVGEILL